MKKILSIALCAVMTALSSVSVSAATTNIQPTVSKNFKIIGTDTIPDNTVRLYSYGENIDTDSRLVFINEETSSKTVVIMSQTSTPVDTILASTSGYELWCYSTCGGCKYNSSVNFNQTGGTYQKMRFRLSDFSDYFNEDGTHTKTFKDDTHDYNFTDEGNGYYSSLLIISGSAMTFAAPDEYGYVTAYVSTKLGDKVTFKTDFAKWGDSSYSGGGGISERFKRLTVGDVYGDGYISVYDATYLQKYLAETVTLDGLSLRNADTNNDGSVNVTDATAIQKYLVQD